MNPDPYTAPVATLAPAPSGDLQLDRAEIGSPARAVMLCVGCKREIRDLYFEIAGKIACSACAKRTEAVLHERLSTPTFFRAVLYGAGAAALGAVAWHAIRSITGYEIGLVAIGVGIGVGLAVKRASGGVGGKRYQALAMFLTYSAVAVTNVPLILNAARDGHAASSSSSAAHVAPGVGVAPVAPTAPPATPPSTDGSSPNSRPTTSIGAFVAACALLLALAYVVPFMGGTDSILGVLIIGFGVYEAWKLNKRIPTPIRGPFHVSA